MAPISFSSGRIRLWRGALAEPNVLKWLFPGPWDRRSQPVRDPPSFALENTWKEDLTSRN